MENPTESRVQRLWKERWTTGRQRPLIVGDGREAAFTGRRAETEKKNFVSDFEN